MTFRLSSVLQTVYVYGGLEKYSQSEIIFPVLISYANSTLFGRYIMLLNETATEIEPYSFDDQSAVSQQSTSLDLQNALQLYST